MNERKEYFDFDRIRMLFEEVDHESCLQVISDQVCDDLDFEELFMTMDRTSSCPGQQLLYNFLRVLPENSSRSKVIENLINVIDSDEARQRKLRKILNELISPGSYFLVRIFTRPHLQKPRWYFFLPFLSIATLLLAVTSFFYKVAILPLLLSILINSIFHFWNKGNVLSYSNALPQLNLLRRTARRLHKMGFRDSANSDIDIDINETSRISRLSAILQIDAENRSEFGQIANYLFDLVKIIFLIEPIVIFRILDLLEDQKKAIKRLYFYVAQLDCADSILQFRKQLNYFTIPVFTQNLETKELYHPMIIEPVSNDLQLDKGGNILITGSNMSGKTTFIRTLGINNLLAQTINTVCAKSWKAPKYKMETSIRLSDDLLEAESYYYREVHIIKEMLKRCEEDYPYLLLLDELFKGTNTRERVASATGVLSYLANGKNTVMVATHDQELADLLGQHYQLFHFDDRVENEKLVFDYQLKTGRLERTNAIKILEINDYPVEVIKTALSVASKMK